MRNADITVVGGCQQTLKDFVYNNQMTLDKYNALTDYTNDQLSSTNNKCHIFTKYLNDLPCNIENIKISQTHNSSQFEPVFWTFEDFVELSYIYPWFMFDYPEYFVRDFLGITSGGGDAGGEGGG